MSHWNLFHFISHAASSIGKGIANVAKSTVDAPLHVVQGVGDLVQGDTSGFAHNMKAAAESTPIYKAGVDMKNMGEDIAHGKVLKALGEAGDAVGQLSNGGAVKGITDHAAVAVAAAASGHWNTAATNLTEAALQAGNPSFQSGTPQTPKVPTTYKLDADPIPATDTSPAATFLQSLFSNPKKMSVLLANLSKLTDRQQKAGMSPDEIDVHLNAALGNEAGCTVQDLEDEVRSVMGIFAAAQNGLPPYQAHFPDGNSPFPWSSLVVRGDGTAELGDVACAWRAKAFNVSIVGTGANNDLTLNLFPAVDEKGLWTLYGKATQGKTNVLVVFSIAETKLGTDPKFARALAYVHLALTIGNTAIMGVMLLRHAAQGAQWVASALRGLSTSIEAAQSSLATSGDAIATTMQSVTEAGGEVTETVEVSGEVGEILEGATVIEEGLEIGELAGA